MITQREQFHDFRIRERVTPYSPYVQQFLSNQSVQNLQHSGGSRWGVATSLPNASSFGSNELVRRGYG
jgi:hypothetical protein